MGTKDHILNTAITLYNEMGLRNITSRDIAKEMGKSHGNIEYHFKDKETLLLAIYKQMSTEMTTFYDQKKPGVNSFEKFDLLLHELELFQIKYGFFNLDILEISRNFKSVNVLLQKTLNTRKEQMRSFFLGFMKENLLKNPKNSDYYLRLQHTIRILITFWVNQELVLTSYDFAKKGEMIRHIWDLLAPFMTEKGKGIYLQLNNSLES